jgi:hypothetical protein
MFLQSTTRVKPFICTMPMRLDDGWNQIQFNLSDFTRRAYGSQSPHPSCFNACVRLICMLRNKITVRRTCKTWFLHSLAPPLQASFRSGWTRPPLYGLQLSCHHAACACAACKCKFVDAGTNYIETLRVQIHANCRIRRIYFSDKLYTEEELPPEFKLFLPVQKAD